MWNKFVAFAKVLGEIEGAAKTAAIVIAGGMIAYFLITSNHACQGKLPAGVVQNGDTNYTPVIKEKERPKSLPTDSGIKEKLPAGVRQEDVSRIIDLVPTDRTGDFLPDKPAEIIETKSGEVYVRKDSAFALVKVIDIEEPIVRPGIFFFVGMTATVNDGLAPAIGASLLVWDGKFGIPFVAADTKGISAGGDYIFHKDLGIGIGRRFDYKGGGELEAKFAYYWNRGS